MLTGGDRSSTLSARTSCTADGCAGRHVRRLPVPDLLHPRRDSTRQVSPRTCDSSRTCDHMYDWHAGDMRPAAPAPLASCPWCQVRPATGTACHTRPRGGPCGGRGAGGRPRRPETGGAGGPVRLAPAGTPDFRSERRAQGTCGPGRTMHSSMTQGRVFQRGIRYVDGVPGVPKPNPKLPQRWLPPGCVSGADVPGLPAGSCGSMPGGCNQASGSLRRDLHRDFTCLKSQEVGLEAEPEGQGLPSCAGHRTWTAMKTAWLLLCFSSRCHPKCCSQCALTVSYQPRRGQVPPVLRDLAARVESGPAFPEGVSVRRT